MWKDIHWFLSLLFQFPSIVQPLEHVALDLSCISVCVNQLLGSTHAHTHLITDKAGGHIPDHEYNRDKHSQTEREKDVLNFS